MADVLCRCACHGRAGIGVTVNHVAACCDQQGRVLPGLLDVPAARSEDRPPQTCPCGAIGGYWSKTPMGQWVCTRCGRSAVPSEGRATVDREQARRFAVAYAEKHHRWLTDDGGHPIGDAFYRFDRANQALELLLDYVTGVALCPACAGPVEGGSHGPGVCV